MECIWPDDSSCSDASPDPVKCRITQCSRYCLRVSVGGIDTRPWQPHCESDSIESLGAPDVKHCWRVKRNCSFNYCVELLLIAANETVRCMHGKRFVIELHADEWPLGDTIIGGGGNLTRQAIKSE